MITPEIIIGLVIIVLLLGGIRYLDTRRTPAPALTQFDLLAEKLNHIETGLNERIDNVLRRVHKVEMLVQRSPDETQEFRIVGDYKVGIVPHGSGGMGIVYKGEDNLGRTIALKEIRPEHSDKPDFRRRFEREARILAKLKHRNICEVYAYGADDPLWLVMEFLEGVPLREKTLPLNPATAIDVFRSVAEALDYAHAQGVVHCDIKPSNIVIDGDRVVVIDWGLGFAANVSPENALARTEHRGAHGTALYAAPEQTRDSGVGSENFVRSESDIYSLGCTMYHLLMGRPPFIAPTRIEVAQLHQYDARPVVVGVANWLAELVTRCMSAFPEDRPTAAEIVRIIDANRTYS